MNVDANPGQLGEAGRSEPGRPGGVNPRVPRQVWIAWASAAAALVFLKAAPLTFIDPDLFHQLSLAREIVETGALDPDAIHLPGIYVHRLVLNATPEKRIEKRTVRAKEGV